MQRKTLVSPYVVSPDCKASFERISSAQPWKDSTADERYVSYIEKKNIQTRPTRYECATGALLFNEPSHISIAAQNSFDLTKRTFTGRKRVWPGALFLLLLCIGALTAIVLRGAKLYRDAQRQLALSSEFLGPNKTRKITPLKICATPNYITLGSKIYATHSGQRHLIRITGINWSGMENIEGVPHGLAYLQSNIDVIAEKLGKMNINAVRLPLNAKMIYEDSPPNVRKFVNVHQNPELNVASYVDMVKKIVQGLAKQQILVLLDMHKIDPSYAETTSEPLWFSSRFSLSLMLKVYRKLASELCNDLFYNIIGIDLKNEPVGGCWPADDTDKSCPSELNWPRAAELLGNAVLDQCPDWLIFVEGLVANNIRETINGVNVSYNDWFGASLQNATINPITLRIPDKLVYAPHFYSPSVYPSAYFFREQETNVDGSIRVVEYENNEEGNKLLNKSVAHVIDAAWGAVLKSGKWPVLYGEFGGIYGEKELLEEKTSTRVVDYLITYADERGMAGGFSWALNWDGRYDFNDAFRPKTPWHFGLYANEKWETYNEDYAAALQRLRGNGLLSCFKRTMEQVEN